jgi:hypothetical protein
MKATALVKVTTLSYHVLKSQSTLHYSVGQQIGVPPTDSYVHLWMSPST